MRSPDLEVVTRPGYAHLRPVPNPDAIAFRALKTKSGLSTEHKLAVGARARDRRGVWKVER